MLFQELDKLKRRIVMTSIILMSVGILLLILPVGQVGFASAVIGFALIILSIVLIFRFIDGSKILIHYLQLCLGLFAGLLGFSMWVFDGLFITLLRVLVGTVPIVSGLIGVIHSFTFARRSGKKSWWVLTILSAAMILFGALVFFNPWVESDEGLMRVSGGAMMCSAFVSALRLIWSFSPNKAEE